MSTAKAPPQAVPPTAVPAAGAVSSGANGANLENGQENGTARRQPNGHRTTKRPRLQRQKPQPQGAATPSAAPQAWRIVPLPVEQIEPGPYQPRLSFDADEMAELVASVRSQGVQQPIIVRTAKAAPEPVPNGTITKRPAARNGTAKSELLRYELIAGERRLRACKEAGRRTIPAILRDDLSDAECAELALLENVQRSNLSVIEEARGYKRLMVQFRMKEERIARKVGKSVATIREMLKLLQLPEPVQKLLAQKKLTAAHGQELLRLAASERVCVLVAERIVKDHLTARSLELLPLPNVGDLKRSKLVAELDYKTKFDWRDECARCPFKAFVPSGYSSYCLKPEEWHKKQQAALELQQQEAARVMAEARQANGQPLEASQLTPGSFHSLRFATPPAGCTAGCPCRGAMQDPHDPTQSYPICLDPARYNELAEAQRQAQEDTRRQHYLALWQQAQDTLQADMSIQALGRLAALLALPILQAQFCRYLDRDVSADLCRIVSESLGIALPWDELLDEEQEDTALYALLQEQFAAQPEQLLLLCGCSLLAYEAHQAVRFGGTTPSGLGFVLGIKPTHQAELPSDAAEKVAGEEVAGQEASPEEVTPTKEVTPTEGDTTALDESDSITASE